MAKTELLIVATYSGLMNVALSSQRKVEKSRYGSINPTCVPLVDRYQCSVTRIM